MRPGNLAIVPSVAEVEDVSVIQFVRVWCIALFVVLVQFSPKLPDPAVVLATPAAAATPAEYKMPYPPADDPVWQKMGGAVQVRWTGGPHAWGPYVGDNTKVVPTGFGSGMDFATSPAQSFPVEPIAAGTVLEVSQPGKCNAFGLGCAVVIKQDDGIVAIYGHLTDGSIQVHDGSLPGIQADRVGPGTLLAWSGSTGGNFPIHLHVELRDGQTCSNFPVLPGQPQPCISGRESFGYPVSWGDGVRFIDGYQIFAYHISDAYLDGSTGELTDGIMNYEGSAVRGTAALLGTGGDVFPFLVGPSNNIPWSSLTKPVWLACRDSTDPTKGCPVIVTVAESDVKALTDCMRKPLASCEINQPNTQFAGGANLGGGGGDWTSPPAADYAANAGVLYSTNLLAGNTTGQVCTTGVPVLNGPPDGMTITAGQSIAFSWSAVPGCTRYRFEAWDDSSPGVGNWVAVDGTSYVFAPNTAGSWRWQVRVEKDDGTAGDAPHTNGFSVASTSGNTCAGGVPSLASPADGANLTAGQATTFSWSAVPGCSRYRFEAWDDSSAGVGNWVDVDGTSYSFAPGVTGSWRWQARVRKSDGSVGDAPHTNGFVVSGSSAGHDWAATYYGDTNLGTQCNASGIDGTYVFQDWKDNAAISGCPADNWSARFTRRMHFDGGSYTFGLGSDDWGRLWVDNDLVVNNWQGAGQHYEGRQLAAGDHDIKVEYADTLGSAKVSAWWWGPGYDLPQDSAQDGCWLANYWANPELWWDTAAKVRDCSTFFDHDWGSDPPVKILPADQFSGAAVKTTNFDAGWTRFHIRTDDGGRLYVDGSLYLDDWMAHSATERVADVQLAAGTHTVRYEFVDFGGDASAHVWWDPAQPSPPSTGDPCGGGTVAYWDMSEGSGNVIHDKCNGYDASWSQGVTWGSDPAEGPYLQFAGGNGQRILINQPALSDATSTTVELRVMPNSSGQRIISQMGPNQLRYDLDWSGSRLDVWGQTGDGWLWFCGDGNTNCLAPGKWVTIQFQIDGSLVHLFYDGQLKWSGSLPYPQTLRQTGAPTEIGAGEDVSDFDGKIQYIRISRGVRSDFLPAHRSLALNTSKAGTGDGSVVSVPPGISCGAVCTQSFDAGTLVTLNAKATVGSTFSGWSGDCTGTDTCTVTLNAARSVTATFDSVQYGLTVSKSGTGTGTLTSSPAGLNCGATCTYSFAGGTSVTLTAVPDPGSTFAGWVGVCSGTDSCTVALDRAESVTASFDRATTLSASPTSVQSGAAVTATWSQLAPSGNDWISVHPAGAADSQYLEWKPISGASGSVDFSAPSSAGMYDFRLFSNGPRVATSNAFQVASPPPPSLSSVLPQAGISTGATTVALTGSNFVTGATVTFGGVAATNISVTSPASITATTPPHAAGAVDVAVTNPDGQTARLVGAFQYVAPVITQAGFAPTVFSPNGDGAGDSVSLLYTLAQDAQITVKIYDRTPAANLVRTLIDSRTTPAGSQTDSWDGKSANGSNVTDGSYTIDVVASVGGVPVQDVPMIVSVDTVAPTVNIDMTRVGTPTSPTSATTATFTFTSSEGGSAFQCRLDQGNFTACTSPATYSSLGVGSHVFTVKATDLAGNTGPIAACDWTVLSAGSPNVSSVKLSAGTVTGGASVTGTVTLASAAPAAGTVVALSSSDVAAVVPATVTVGGGATTATFSLTTSPVLAQTAVKITATSGSSSAAATLTIKSPVVSALSLSPGTILGGKPSTGTVKLTGAAPANGVVVALTTDASAAATTPETVTVSSGATTATFAISTAPVASTFKVNIGAATGMTSKSAVLTVTAPAPSTLSFASRSLTGGCQGTTGTVTLSAAVVADTTVTLTASAGGQAVSSMPASVVVPAGTSTAQFSIGTQGVTTATTVSVMATANGASKTATFKVGPPVPTILTVSPTAVNGGAASTATLLVDCAPVADLTVALSVTSGSAAVASLPSSVTIPAGATTTTFSVATKTTTVKTSVKIQATADGVSKTATLTVNP